MFISPKLASTRKWSGSYIDATIYRCWISGNLMCSFHLPHSLISILLYKLHPLGISTLTIGSPLDARRGSTTSNGGRTQLPPLAHGLPDLHLRLEIEQVSELPIDLLSWTPLPLLRPLSIDLDRASRQHRQLGPYLIDVLRGAPRLLACRSGRPSNLNGPSSS